MHQKYLLMMSYLDLLVELNSEIMTHVFLTLHCGLICFIQFLLEYPTFRGHHLVNTV